MRCPTCRKEFHAQPDRRQAYFLVNEEDPEDDSGAAFGVAIQLCPSCHNMVVIYQEGEAVESGGEAKIMTIKSERVIFPETDSGRELPSEVPNKYRSEFEEASVAYEYSAKASAALSRRLLQKVLREELGIRKKDLSLEIDDFIESSGAPSYLTGAVDAIRTVGNFAAHPLKSKSTGEIVEVEEGEAEWLLEVLESLFDFVFVQPARLKQRKEGLNQKLRDLGKPELKGT